MQTDSSPFILLLNNIHKHYSEDMQKIELIGFNAGFKLAETLTRDRQRFTDTLDKIKWICKEFWQLIFNSTVDNLKTNHRGVYVLTGLFVK